MTDKTFNDIKKRLTSKQAQAEHKRIWAVFKETFKPEYLSAYLVYLKTFAIMQDLLNIDTSEATTGEIYKFTNSFNCIANQHKAALKLLNFAPSLSKTSAKTGRRIKDTLLNV